MLMTSTTLYQMYGAILYNTPWRMHVVLASIPIIIFTSVVSKTADKQCEYKKIMQWMFWGVTLIVSVMAIGFFEGFITICLKMCFFCRDRVLYTAADVSPAKICDAKRFFLRAHRNLSGNCYCTINNLLYTIDKKDYPRDEEKILQNI